MYGARISFQKLKNILVCIIIYLLLLLNNGFGLCAMGGALEFARVGIAMGFLFLGGRKIARSGMLPLFALLLIIAVSSIINGDSQVTLTVIIFDVVAAYAIAAYCKDKDGIVNLAENFRRVMLAVCIVSSAAFLVAYVKPTAFYSFPTFAQGYHRTNFIGLSFVYKVRQYNFLRNPGIFWEPGAFQTYIILAMMAERFVLKSKKIINYVIYIIAMITTVSTTGILTMVLLLAFYAFTRKNKAVGIVMCALIVAVVGFVYINQEMLPKEIRYALFEKTESLVDSGADAEMTTRVRTDSIKYPLQAFADSPVIGVGRNGMKEWSNLTGHTMNTCTPVNWLAHYGLLAFLIIAFGFFRFTKLIFKNMLARIGIFAIFMLSISTEPFNYEPTLLFMSFVGHQLAGKVWLGASDEGKEENINENIVC